MENYKEKRPWGSFTRFALNEPVTVKIIEVEPNQAFSLQTHKKREEFWHIISGNGQATIGEKIFDINPDMNIFVSKNTEHRIKAGNQKVLLLEISRGQFDENDINRINDLYGRK